MNPRISLLIVALLGGCLNGHGDNESTFDGFGSDGVDSVSRPSLNTTDVIDSSLPDAIHHDTLRRDIEFTDIVPAEVSSTHDPRRGDADASGVVIDTFPTDVVSDSLVNLVKCEPLQAGEPLPIAEASGAEFVNVGGESRLLVVSDSGHGGQFVLYQPQSGQLTSGALPVDDGASDDLEGVAADALGTVYAITSSGYVRHWRFTAEGTALAETLSYPLSDFGGDLESCTPFGINCGKNFEGLCLSRLPLDNGCSGYAVSKAEGALYCVTGGNGTPLGINPGVDPLYVAPENQLSGCALSGNEFNTLYVALNIYGGSDVLRVTFDANGSGDWQKLGLFAGINPEAIAVDDAGVIWVINDTQNLTNDAPFVRYQCVSE